MSGHSKWSTIKRKKGAADAKRGAAFTKYANAIALAAKDGADPEMNFKLRLAIDGARSVNMPIASIDKAIARGGGQAGGVVLEENVYEGYGPGGVAVLVQCVTDNRNRTAAAVRSVFTKFGGNLANPGAVAYQFESAGVIQIETDDSDGVSLAAIDAGAKDVEVDNNLVTVYTDPKDLAKVRANLDVQSFNVVSAELSFQAKQLQPVADADTATKVLRFMESLEELDDVQNVFANFDIPDSLLNNLS